MTLRILTASPWILHSKTIDPVICQEGVSIALFCDFFCHTFCFFSKKTMWVSESLRKQGGMQANSGGGRVQSAWLVGNFVSHL